jgi:hypothetical protein
MLYSKSGKNTDVSLFLLEIALLAEYQVPSHFCQP